MVVVAPRPTMRDLVKLAEDLLRFLQNNSTNTMRQPTASGTRRLWCRVGTAEGRFCLTDFKFTSGRASLVGL